MKIRAYITIGLAGGCKRSEDIEIPDEELEGMDAKMREAHINEYVEDWGKNIVQYDWEDLGQ